MSPPQLWRQSTRRKPTQKFSPRHLSPPAKTSLGSPCSPRPWPHGRARPLRVIFAAEKPLDGELSLIAPNGNIAAASGDRHGGPPYFWFAEVASPAAGTWQAMLVRGDAAPECRTVTRNIVVQRREPPRPVKGRGVWPLRDAWDRDTENLYSAWIEKLFDAPLDEELSWSAMHEVLRDKSRNVLFNSSGSARGREGPNHSAGLRRRSLFPARLFRLQDGAAVRLFEMHARRRRPGAEMPAVVEHRERGAHFRAARGASPAGRAGRLLRHVRRRLARCPCSSFRRSRKVSCLGSAIT